MIHITTHAVERYQERVANLPEADVRAALSSPAVVAAMRFGARFVRLATGQRIVIDDGAVITVLPAQNYRRQVARMGVGRFSNRYRYFGEEV